MEENKKYDVGIFGLWYGHNYGSIITYYALANVISSMGYTTAMIKNPLGSEIDVNTLRKSHALRFAAKHYDITPLYRISQMKKINDICDKFLLGSDQMWNYELSKPYQQSYFLDFADDDKIKVAYATSFGREKYEAPQDYKAEAQKNLSRFSAISVRDDFSRAICEKEFGIIAEQVIDPVFLCPVEKYEQLIEEADKKYSDDFFFAYILDPNPEWGKTLRSLLKKTGKRAVVIFDEEADKKSAVERLGAGDENIEYFIDADVGEWLCCFKNADFVVTDSFHGASFSMIFRKTFAVLKNGIRGGGRFDCLLNMAGLMSQMVTDATQIDSGFEELILNRKIDYSNVEKRIEDEKKIGYEWLKGALEGKKINRKINKGSGLPKANISQDPDLERCRMLVSLMKDYGIKHVVLSSGSRHANLCKFFEANKYFKTYNVVDERSAGFFAIGLSLKLNQTVAICCTSGTAASNYISPISEAFYQNVPILVITVDRYPCLLNQQEQQMVPQMNIFNGIVKKSVALPINNDRLGRWETKRMICESLLEINHRGKGPVHINVPIINLINRRLTYDETALVKYQMIHRITYMPDRSSWKASVEKLKQSHRIILLWGQTAPPSKDELNAINKFAKIFDCVICTDHLSNLHCDKSVHAYNIAAIFKNNKNIPKELAPDILITTDGNNIVDLNDIINQSTELEHWSVLPDGRIADHYRKLYKVFECNIMQFIKRMNFMAEGVSGGSSYYEKWLEYKPEKKLPEEYGQRYATGSVILGIPANSDLHLGNSNTVRFANEYELNEDVTVYCNRGTNGIDGSVSSFMGMCAASDKLCFMLTGDLAFFYDLNSLWNKDLKGNIRIMLFNNNGTSLLKHHGSKAITYRHNTVAEGWVKSLGFKYLSSKNKEEFDAALPEFLAEKSDQAVFFEVFC